MADQTEDISKNCVACNKHLRRIRRYYRDGKYYCSPNCWRDAKAKLAEQAAEK